MYIQKQSVSTQAHGSTWRLHCVIQSLQLRWTCRPIKKHCRNVCLIWADNHAVSLVLRTCTPFRKLLSSGKAHKISCHSKRILWGTTVAGMGARDTTIVISKHILQFHRSDVSSPAQCSWEWDTRREPRQAVNSASRGRTEGKRSTIVDCIWNMMAHAQKPDFFFRRNGRVHLNRQERQFSHYRQRTCAHQR